MHHCPSPNFQIRTIPLTFRNANICLHRYAFASALSLALHHHACLINALFVLHPHYPSLCTTTLASLVKGRWIDGKAQTVALLRFACDTSTFLIYQTFCRQDGGIASPPSLAPRQPFQNRTIPRKSPTHLPPLPKVRCCRPKEFGRLPEGLPHHHPSLLTNPSKTTLSPRSAPSPLPFNERSVCFASIPRQPLVPLHRTPPFPQLQ